MNKTDLNIKILIDSFKKLKEAWAVYNTDIDQKLKEMVADSCIQRFEYTMEISWKLMKKYLKLEYGKTDTELTVNNIFRLMEGYSMIRNWEKWKLYYAHRNDTSHDYNIQKAKELLLVIPDFIKEVDYLIKSFKKVLD